MIRPHGNRHLITAEKTDGGTDAMDAYHQHSQILNRYTVAQVLLTEPLISSVRRELKKFFPDVKIEHQHITDILNNEVLKREVIEGEKAKETQQKFKRITNKLAKLAEKKTDKPAHSPPATP